MIRRGALLVAIAVAAVPIPAPAQVVDEAGDWLLVCDNKADCTILGTPPLDTMPGYPRVELRIDRGHQADAAMLLNIFTTRGQADNDLTGLTLNGLAISRGPATAPLIALRTDPRITGVPGRDYFTAEETAQIVAVIASHRPAYLRSGFGAFAPLPVGNLARLLRRMDRVQAAARQAGSDDDHAFSSGAPAFELFARDRVENAVDHPLFHRRCRGASTSHASGYAVDHTTVPTLLVHLTCGGRHYFYSWYPIGSAPPAPIVLDRPRPRGADRTSATFNPDDGTLTLVDHPAGRTDCGLRTLWGWIDGEGMVLLETAIMPRCRGIATDRWPQSYDGPRWFAR